MTPKRTPGPWRWLNESALCGDHGHRPVVLAACPNRERGVAEFRQRDASGRLVLLDPESPDALLIASAPALREALEGLVARFEEFTGPDDDGDGERASTISEWRRIARAALGAS